MFRVRQKFTKKETIRISIGTWNINGDKNPALDNEYPAILDAWILNGPENIIEKDRKENAIATKGRKVDESKEIEFDLLLQDLSAKIILNQCRIY